MTIRSKILALSAAFAVLAAVVAGLGVLSLSRYAAMVEDLDRVHRHAYFGERLNRLVTAVVMESRGIYASSTQESAARFAKGIEAEITTAETLLADWRADLGPTDDVVMFEAVARSAGEFFAFRRELARLGTEDSIEAADAFGNNEANRANRKAFQADIDRLVDADRQKLDAAVARIDEFRQSSIAQFLGLTALGSLAMIAVSLWLSIVGVARPLNRVTTAIGAIADGAYGTTIPTATGRDEISRLWRATATLRDKALEAEAAKARQADQEAAAAAALVAERHRIADAFQDRMGRLAKDFASSSEEVAGAAENLSATAEETARQAQSVTGAAESAAYNVQTVATSTEELSASVREITEQVTTSARTAAAAAEETARTEATILALSEAATQIGDVVQLISEIAGQTNLLALNATIEAARAGEAGRGFAVVASEVKNLAGQTAKATDDIARKVSEIQAATRTTVSSIGAIVGTIGTIREVTAAIASAVEQQGAAANEIAVNTQRASSGTQDVTGNINGVGHSAEMTGAAATQLMSLSGTLKSRAATLQKEVESFVGTLRAA